MSKPTAADIGRECLSCGATQTPVWRTGPTGPKTMCNRCGIKWMRQNPISERGRKFRNSSDSYFFITKQDSNQMSEHPGSSPETQSRKKRRSFDEEYDCVGKVVEDEEAFLKVTNDPRQKRKAKKVEVRTEEELEEDSYDLTPMRISSIEYVEKSPPTINPALEVPTNTYEEHYSNDTEQEDNFSEIKNPIPIPSEIKNDYPKVINRFNPINSEMVDYRRYLSPTTVSVQYLDLSHNPMSVNGQVLRSLPCTLEYLNLTLCKKLTDSDLLSLPPSLKTLILAHCSQLSDECLKHLPHSLLHLNISNCYNITDEGVKSLPMTLTSLNMAFCYKITDDGMVGLPPLLTQLSVESCKITNEGLKLLPTSLAHLNLQSCDGITDEGLSFLPHRMDTLNLGYTSVSRCESLRRLSLKYLDLTQCNINDETIPNLPSTLEHLNLFKCSKVTDVSTRNLPPSLEFVNFRSTSITSTSLPRLEQIRTFSYTPNLKIYI